MDHEGQSRHSRLPAGRAAVVKDVRARTVLSQFPLDPPHHPLALFLIGLTRLPVDQLVHLGATVSIVVQFAAAPVKQLEILVGVGPTSGAGEADDVILAHDLRKPNWSRLSGP